MSATRIDRRRFLAASVARTISMPGWIGAAAATAAPVRSDDLYEREAVLAEPLKALAGKPVEMIGYMAPPLKAEANFFVLTRTPMAVCPFCETEMQWPDDIVLVLTGDTIDAVPYNRRIRVRGTLDLGFEKDPDTGFVSLVRIENAGFERL